MPILSLYLGPVLLIISNLHSVAQEYDPMNQFMYGLRAPETRRQYPRRLKIFLDFLQLDGSLDFQVRTFYCRTRDDPSWAQEWLMKFISFQLDRVNKGEISEATVPNYYKAVKLFCEMNDLTLSWKKISKGLPNRKMSANDRAPTIDEIRKLAKYPDRRIRAIIYTMISSGMRIGAWDFLQWKHVIPIKDQRGEIIAAKLIVYPGDREEYYTFITSEAYNELEEWKNFRIKYGEVITENSWVMRDLWQTTNVDHRYRNGLATCPRKLKSSGIKRLIERALWDQGLRIPLKDNKRRHEWKAAHGFRKYYKTRTEQVMKPINVEITMGHNIGVSASYYKPTEKEVLEDYLKAISLLTINNDKPELEKQVKELTEKSKDSEYIIQRKLAEKDKEIGSLKNRDLLNSEAIGSLSDLIQELSQKVKQLELRNGAVEEPILTN